MNPDRPTLYFLTLWMFGIVSGSCQVQDRTSLLRFPAVEPDRALDTMSTAPGFRMELVAAEPLVHDPVAMAFDENGSLYVVEMRGYSEQREDRLGAVRRLEDVDHDGRFESSTVFVDGLAWPTAVACWKGGVFVAAPPDIWYFKDGSGDEKADEKRRVLTGFSHHNVQAMVNSFRWGLDNRIHGATSSGGGEVAGLEGADEPLKLRLRDFAFDPMTMEFSATTEGGQHGMGFDDWGRKFSCSNSEHIKQVVYEERYVADMYREIIEHPWSFGDAIKPLLDLTSGHDRGRIYRIVHDDGTTRKPEPLGDKSSAELSSLLGHTNAWHRDTAARLLYERQDRSATSSIRTVAQNSANPLGRMHAFYALQGLAQLRADDIIAALSDAHPGVRQHAARLAETFVARESVIRDKLISMAGDPDLRVRFQVAFSLGEMEDQAARIQAITSLLRRDRYDSILDAVEKGELNPGDFSAVQIQRLCLAKDEQQAARAVQLLSPNRQNNRSKLIDDYRLSLSIPGDVARGRAIYRKSCAVCHRAEQVGNNVGPTSATFRNRGREWMLVNILDPNREVNPEFTNYILLMKDGRTAAGLITAETPNSLTVTRADGRSEAVLRSDLEELVSSQKSLMPEGLEKVLDRQSMADLLAYLVSLE